MVVFAVSTRLEDQNRSVRVEWWAHGDLGAVVLLLRDDILKWRAAVPPSDWDCYPAVQHITRKATKATPRARPTKSIPICIAV